MNALARFFFLFFSILRVEKSRGTKLLHLFRLLLFYIYADFDVEYYRPFYFPLVLSHSRDSSPLSVAGTAARSCSFPFVFCFPSIFRSSKTSCQSLPFLNEDMLKAQLRTSRGILLIHITYKIYILYIIHVIQCCRMFE